MEPKPIVIYRGTTQVALVPETVLQGTKQWFDRYPTFDFIVVCRQTDDMLQPIRVQARDDEVARKAFGHRDGMCCFRPRCASGRWDWQSDRTSISRLPNAPNLRLEDAISIGKELAGILKPDSPAAWSKLLPLHLAAVAAAIIMSVAIMTLSNKWAVLLCVVIAFGLIALAPVPKLTQHERHQ